MQRQGFTLLELLIVIAIIGILMGIFGIGFIRSIRTAEVREAATQVATDLRRARSNAQRGSANIAVVAPGVSGGTTYTVGGQVQIVPNNVTLLCKPPTSCSGSSTTVTYQAPYGELGSGATGNVFTLRSPMTGIDSFEVRLVGVTGKVILTKAIP